MGTYDSLVDGLLQVLLGDYYTIVVADPRLGGTRLRGGLKCVIGQTRISIGWMNRLYIAVPRLASPLELVPESARHKNLSNECQQGIEEDFTGSAATGSGAGSFGAFVAT